MPDTEEFKMMMVTVGDAEDHANPKVRECTALVVEFAGRLDTLVAQMVTEHDASKVACNAVIGALSAVLGRQAAQFSIAASMDEKRTDYFFTMTADSVKQNAIARLPDVRESLVDWLKVKKNQGEMH